MSEIRVRNDTGRGLDTVRATLAGATQPVLLGPLPPGAVSDWQTVHAVPRYPAIEASGPGTDLVHLPYEDEGQALLAEGRYTYVLRIESDRLVVGLEPED
jgi:hypothetical protein